MAAIGDASLWADTLPDGFVPDIIEVVLDAWSRFQKPKPSEKEVTTTRRLRGEMLQTARLRDLPLRIDPEVSLSDPVTGEEIGKLDLRFTTPRRVNDSVYFAIECKRLYARPNKNKPPVALADRYVLKGMMRFVTEQYSKGLEDAAMIAYVMTGPLDQAVQAVRGNLSTNCAKLRMKAPGDFVASTASKKPCVLMTEHGVTVGTFRLQHVFLVCQIPPSP